MNELKEKYDNENLTLKNKDIQREINLRNKSLQESHKRFWLISIFLFLLAISFVILYLTWLNNRKKNKLLEVQNTQKNFLIQEIHHRVKNNLQFVKSILSMQESVPEISANETIEDISRRIDAMYLLHELLYQDKNITKISSKEYFDKLISNSLNIYTLDQKIILKTDIEEIELKVEQLISLGLIVAELITNSAKHVFNQTVNPELSIKMSNQNNLISLIVKDNGLENDNLIEDNRHKLGVRMIHIFVRQINAELTIKKENGYCVEIKFKP
jgi:two-component sensor histidine kinase